MHSLSVRYPTVENRYPKILKMIGIYVLCLDYQSFWGKTVTQRNSFFRETSIAYGSIVKSFRFGRPAKTEFVWPMAILDRFRADGWRYSTRKDLPKEKASSFWP